VLVPIASSSPLLSYAQFSVPWLRAHVHTHRRRARLLSYFRFCFTSSPVEYRKSSLASRRCVSHGGWTRCPFVQALVRLRRFSGCARQLDESYEAFIHHTMYSATRSLLSQNRSPHSHSSHEVQSDPMHPEVLDVMCQIKWRRILYSPKRFSFRMVQGLASRCNQSAGYFSASRLAGIDETIYITHISAQYVPLP
jgi:hypothetical protein